MFSRPTNGFLMLFAPLTFIDSLVGHAFSPNVVALLCCPTNILNRDTL